MLQEYRNKYLDKFEENFPLFHFMGVDEEEIIEIIKHCLDTGNPYDEDCEDGRLL